MPSEKEISAEFPFESQFVEVHGSQMHYVDEGEGDPVLFLHGNPTSSYLWRNIIPYVTPTARAIAPDLIGMGRSDRPDIPYRFFDHWRYVEGFIEALDLRNITFVVHDWGSALAFHYARRHESNVKGIAFMEAILRPATWEDFPGGFKLMFKLFRTPVAGWLLIVAMNFFVRQILPQATARKLTAEEMRRYAEPFSTWASRRPVLQWPREIPIDGNPADVERTVRSYSNWLEVSELPKLLFHATPGGLIPPPLAEWVKANFKNLEAVDIGQGIHYVQEDNPHQIGEALAAWYGRLSR
jgi:haloalkane dehalogenase